MRKWEAEAVKMLEMSEEYRDRDVQFFVIEPSRDREKILKQGQREDVCWRDK